MSQDLRHHDRIVVQKDGEEVVVYNWANITVPTVVRGGNPRVERFEPEIGAGDSQMKPDYVTEWVADEIWGEFGVDVEDHGIEVIDVESNEVTIV